ncbi:RpnC/YadD family protein [Cohnella abietis]|uniref:Transposase n=1 Tax=Cohnella abietis TaxID=2507935 RepID=A0A3T1D9J9_9BACL|nr:transposase [Cohnella abietis]BBI34766.1 transposase [Cohnella abietis]
MSIDHDRLFKELLQIFFKEFMELFFPKACSFIDFSHVTFLSEELFTDVMGGATGRVDVLIETRLLEEEVGNRGGMGDTDKALIIVHLEPQSYYQINFSERMFLYSSKLYEKYRRRILPIAIFNHEREAQEPDNFSWHFPFLSVMTFRYFTVQLSKHNWREFLDKDNPVAAALLSSMGYNKSERVMVKLEFLRMMMKMQLDPARMRILTVFFETYLQLTPAENIQLQENIERIYPHEEEKLMEWMTSWEKKGKEEGLQEGLLKGKEEGIQESKQEIALKMLEKGLNPEIIEELTGLSSSQISKLQKH